MKSLRLFSIIVFLTMFLSASAADSPETVLSKSIGILKKAKAIECNFRLSGNGTNVSGSLLTSGSKFKLASSAGTTWFDGSNMWTSNDSSREITLVTPTAEEVSESNPFAYLNSYTSKFKAFFSKRQDVNRYLVLLNPKKNNTEIKAIEVAINKKTYLPERFIIRDSNDRVTTIEIKSVNLKASAKSGDFVCPVSSMNGYELVDLR